MEGMKGGSPTKDEIEKFVPPAKTETIAPETSAPIETETVVVPPAPQSVASESEPLVAASDPATYAGKVDKIYFELAQRLRKIGVEPNDLPEEWGAAVKAREAVIDLSKRYEKETHKVKRAELANHMRRFAKNLMGTITNKAEKAAEEYRKTHKKPLVPQRLSNKETRDVISEALDHLPVNTDTPVVPPIPPGEPPEKNSPSAYSGKLAELENAYHTRYPDGKDIPPEVSEKYFALTKAGLGSMFSTDTASAAKTEETEAEIETLIAKLSVPPMPMVPPPVIEAIPQAPQANEPEVDASEFAAPQYAERGMQEEMDVLNESSPEPEPAVFRKNRERLIPTLTDVVELPGQRGVAETAEQAPEARPFGVGTEIRDDGMEYVNILPGSAGGEGTPKEWHEKLKALIENAKGKVEWWKSSEEHLIRRSEELNVAAEKIGWGEKKFRWLGEQYNKFGWKTKLAVGIGLGIGYGAALSAVSLPAIFACIAGIGAQRAAGLATMYLKYEKARPYGDRNQEGFWNWSGSREKAMMKSIVYTAVMTGGMAYMAKEISDRDLVHRTKEWLGGMMDTFVGNHPETGAVATAPSVLPQTAISQGGEGVKAAEEIAKAASESPAAAPIPEVKVPKPEFQMPRHADFSIHEDDIEISPYDVTPTDQSGAEDAEDIAQAQANEESQPIESPTEAVQPESAPAESTAPSPAAEVGPHGFLSANGTPINPDVTHGYASPKGVYVFGGNVSDVQAQEYALANRVSVFVDKSTKILGGLVTLSRVVEFAPSEGGTTTMIIHHDQSLVPDPKTFTKILF